MLDLNNPAVMETIATTFILTVFLTAVVLITLDGRKGNTK